MVTANPSYDEMKKVVTEQEKRPLVPNRWTENSVSDLLTLSFAWDRFSAFQILIFLKSIWVPYTPQKILDVCHFI